MSAAGPAPSAAPSPAGDVPSDQLLAKAGSENFPVAAWFLPGQLRGDLLAIYAYARFVDDIGDENDADAATRLATLDEVDTEVSALFTGAEVTLPAVAGLREGVVAGRFQQEPLRKLVEANRLDQRVSSYATFDDLRHYCTLSADPVGHLVLGAAGVATPERVALSDSICTALQLAEHWQDVAEDRARGRVYIPQEDLKRFNVPDADLLAPHASPALKTLLAFEVARAHELFDQGAPLVRLMPGRARLAIAGFVAGGRAALHAIAAADFDVLAGPPKPAKSRVIREAVRALADRGSADRGSADRRSADRGSADAR